MTGTEQHLHDFFKQAVPILLFSITSAIVVERCRDGCEYISLLARQTSTKVWM